MDYVLRGARVVDGTRAPARMLDIRISGDRITEVGPSLEANGAETVDLTGLHLAPGFIDIHTHLDAQIFWDPMLSPSSWHGVTSVLIGNCGLGIAPTRPEHYAGMIDSLSEVEGIPKEVLEQGVPWGAFTTFPEYLDVIERTPRQLNVASLVGHSPIRVDVMGLEAWDREATDAEVAAMREQVAAALDAGALGFSTSKATGHFGSDGRPVPSRIASKAEIFALADVLREAGRGLIEMPLGHNFFIEEMAELSKKTGRPVTWTGLLTEMDFAGATEEGIIRSMTQDLKGGAAAIVDRMQELGGQVLGQVGPRPMNFRINSDDPFVLATSPGFEEVMSTDRAGRKALYADPVWRDKAREPAHRHVGSWEKIQQIHIETVDGEEHERLDAPLSKLAAGQGVDPFDLFLDIAVESDLEAVFAYAAFNWNHEEVGDLLRDPRTLIGNSDAGAHISSLCESTYPTHFLGHWVRDEKLMSVEAAVWRMTGQPAALLGLKDRGLIREGYVADLVAFDLDTIDTGETRRAYDLPGGAMRLIAESRGVEHVWVSGVPIRSGGQVVADARPGVVLRG